MQTFSQRRREVLELGYTSEDIFNWINMVRKYPFKDISIDLMYGLPGQTIKEWESDLQTALSLPIDHFSIYKLTVFAYVKLYHELENKKVPPLPEETKIFEMFSLADSVLSKNNYVVQSSQEYCRRNRQSLFWDFTYDGYGDNLSFGAFSFGYLNGINYQNLSNPREYIAAIREGQLPIKMVSKKITVEQLQERTMMLSFRKGFVDRSIFYTQYGEQLENKFGEILQKLLKLKYIADCKNGYELTPLGRYYQGNVSAEFMRSTFDNVSPLKKKMAIGMHVVPDALDAVKGRSS